MPSPHPAPPPPKPCCRMAHFVEDSCAALLDSNTCSLMLLNPCPRAATAPALGEGQEVGNASPRDSSGDDELELFSPALQMGEASHLAASRRGVLKRARAVVVSKEVRVWCGWVVWCGVVLSLALAMPHSLARSASALRP